MRLTFRILSALLRYPDALLCSAAPDIAESLKTDSLLSPSEIDALAPLLDMITSEDLIDLQERYVALFDRGRALSLYLFEHVHGESRDRGQAMVDLRARYEEQGLEIEARELPDYLPLFLEYLSVLPLDDALDQLAQPAVIIAALAQRLEERASPYAAPMAILRDLAASRNPTAAIDGAAVAPADDPDDLVALDAMWAEEQIRFSSPPAPDARESCPQAAEMVARFSRPEPGATELREGSIHG